MSSTPPSPPPQSKPIGPATTRTAFLTTLTTLPSLSPTTDPDCPICTETLTRPVQLPCTHVYCYTCIAQWLLRRQRNTCCICRAELFSLKGADRGLVGVDRAALVAQALQNSRLLSNGFDEYEICDVALGEVHRAAAEANVFLASAAAEEEQSLQGTTAAAATAVIEVRTLMPHVIAMGNLLRGYAGANRRAYDADQRRDWKLIVGRVAIHLQASNGLVLRERYFANMAQDLRAMTLESLNLQGGTARSARFFDPDARLESPAGDLDVLLQYIVVQCSKAYAKRESDRAALLQAQQAALAGEKTRVGRALRRFGQALFGGV